MLNLTLRTAGGAAAMLLAGCTAISDTPPVRGAASRVAAVVPAWDAPGNLNPLLPGYFADPSIVQDDGRWYIFATIDPWGSEQLGLWTSDNGRDWSFSRPAWPTKAAAATPDSSDAMVWAPSVVKAPNGQWFMYVSVAARCGSAPPHRRQGRGGTPMVASR